MVFVLLFTEFPFPFYPLLLFSGCICEGSVEFSFIWKPKVVITATVQMTFFFLILCFYRYTCSRQISWVYHSMCRLISSFLLMRYTSPSRLFSMKGCSTSPTVLLILSDYLTKKISTGFDYWLLLFVSSTNQLYQDFFYGGLQLDALQLLDKQWYVDVAFNLCCTC